MSDTTELVQSTIDKVLERVDVLAAKLGIAATEVWKFSVSAKAVEARADIAKSVAVMFLPLVFWGWSLHVVLTKIPHDTVSGTEYQNVTEAKPCDQIGVVNGKQVILHETCGVTYQKNVPRTEDKGISDAGQVLIISAIVTALVGLIFAAIGICGLIEGFAATKTIQYDAYQDLIYDWRN